MLMDVKALRELIVQLRMQLKDATFENFSRYELFGAVWWVLIALIVLPLIVWWILVDKKRLLEISMFGLLLGLINTFLDVIGTDYGLWNYVVHILPESAVLIPVNLIVLPAIQMYVFQNCPKWGKYMIFSILAAAVQAFVAEPLAMLIGQYELIHWSVLYSFPTYIVIDVIAKFIVDLFKKRQEKEITKGSK
jgi:hypothetical protein